MTPTRLDHHNGVLEAAMGRAAQLEERLVKILEPILDRAAADAANAFEAYATDFLTADSRPREATRAGRGVGLHGVPVSRPLLASLALRGAVPGLGSTSTMICVKPAPIEAEEIAAPDGEPADTLHVTLAYLGDVEGTVEPIAEALRTVAASHGPLTGKVAGSGAFDPAPGEPAPTILLPDVPGLVELRVAVTEALVEAGVTYSRLHGFEAHITVDYATPGEGLYRPDSYGKPLTFNEVLIVRGNVVEAVIPLVGPTPLTAAGDPFLEDLVRVISEPITDLSPTTSLGVRLTAAGARWSPPAGDEVINVDQLVSTLRTKTDPVRQAAVENVMKTTLDGTGISYDVTHPLAGKVLSQAGSQITNIAQTTQLNAMRIIAKAHQEGLTIPDTAKALRAGMRSASTARATLIARTEMVGAVNGASLAATQIVAQATGSSYRKEWLTSEGAVFPRHEEYEGLNGQTVDLDAEFDVGGTPLEFPGDPGGPPEEVCNCRCSMVYSEGGTGAGSPDAGLPISTPDGGGGGDGGLGLSPDMGAAITDGPAAEMLDSSYAAWGADLTVGEKDALWAYRSNEGYTRINAALRTETRAYSGSMNLEEAAAPGKGGVGGTYKPSARTINLDGAIVDIDGAMAKSPGLKSPVDATVFRGVRDVNEVFGSGGPRVGQVVEEKAYISTTTEREIADNYTLAMDPSGKEGVIEISIPQGQKGVWMGGVEKGFDPSNREFLLPRNTKLEVTGVRTEHLADYGQDVQVVTVRVVPQEPVVERAVVPETSKHVVAESGTTSAETTVADVYLKSLQDELYTTNNVISYMNRKVRAGTATANDVHRLEALRKRKEDIRELILHPDPKAELARVRNQINYMKRRVRDGSATHETHVRLQLLQARAETLTKLGKGEGLKIQKEAKSKAKKVADDMRALDKEVAEADKRAAAEEAAGKLNYNSAYDVGSLLKDKKAGEVVLIPAHAVPGGTYTYQAGSSLVWRGESGVIFKREVGLDPWLVTDQNRIAARLEAYVQEAPESMRYNLEMVNVFSGSNPADPYWAKKYKQPGFTSAATGGDGEINFWNSYGSTQSQNVFDHELGHVIGDWGGPLDTIEWSQAAARDATASRKFLNSDFYDSTGHHSILLGKRAVTDYGSNNKNEDWAESVRLYLTSRRTGSIGTVTNERGFLKPVKFEDVFPARAKIIARDFPDVYDGPGRPG